MYCEYINEMFVLQSRYVENKDYLGIQIHNPKQDFMDCYPQHLYCKASNRIVVIICQFYFILMSRV